MFQLLSNETMQLSIAITKLAMQLLCNHYRKCNKYMQFESQQEKLPCNLAEKVMQFLR